MKIQIKKIFIIFGIVYRPPNTSTDEFFDCLEDVLGNIYSSFDNIVCVGDFNINILNNSSKLTSQLMHLMDTFNLTQIVDEPTRITDKSITLIDLVFLNMQNVTNKGVIDCNFSDHMLTFFEIKTQVNKQMSNKITFRSLKNIDLDKFNQDLQQIPFFLIYDMDNIDDKCSFFTNSILTLFDLHAPIQTVSKSKHSFSPWITDNIKLMQKLRDKALQKYRLYKTPEKFNYYKQLRNLTTAAIRSEKRAYFNYKFQNSSVKEKWKELNRLRPKKKTDIPENFKDVNKMNQYFIDSTKDQNNINIETLNFYKSNIKENVNNRLIFRPVESMDILKIVTNIKTKAYGADLLNITLIDLCFLHVSENLTHIINQCIAKSYFPTSWKMALVTPLPKVNNPVEYCHFRSISILPTLSKVLEKVLQNQIQDFVEENNVLPPKQSGFRPGCSCATANADVVDDIFRARDDNKLCALVLLDYSKAFDYINHEMLIAILHFCGFSESASKIISSFLTDRVQQVKINKIMSSALLVTKGVPQGSILGPILFSLYTSNFYKCLRECNYHLYADDTQIYLPFSFDEAHLAESNINSDLKSLLKISTDHSLKINPQKSSVLLFGKKHEIEELKNTITIKVGQETLAFQNRGKSLGLILDTELRFKEHTSYILRKAYCALKAIYPHRHYLAGDVKKLLCDTLVLSHFNHCDNVYGPCLDGVDMGRIQKMQNNCLRLIYGIRRRQRISHKLKDCKWLNMVNRRNLHSACIYYKILKHKCPKYLYNKISFRTDVHHLNLRRKHVTIPKHNHEFFKRSFTYCIAKFFNSLSLHQSQLVYSLISFKHKYRHYFWPSDLILSLSLSLVISCCAILTKGLLDFNQLKCMRSWWIGKSGFAIIFLYSRTRICFLRTLGGSI